MTSDKAEGILFNELDPRFKDEVAEKIGLEVIKPCFTCGSCTGVCPVHEVIEDFDPRVIIQMILLGMRKQVLSSDLIWFCCLCNSSEGHVDEGFLEKLEVLKPYLEDLCRRTMFLKVKEGFRGRHTMPCWRKNTNKI